MILVEFLGSFQIRAKSLVSPVQRASQTTADGVVNLVTSHSAHYRQGYQQSQVKISGCRKDPRRYEQRIPWQEKSEKQPRLYENYRPHTHHSAPLNQSSRIQI